MRILPSVRASIDVFRAAFVSIVLTLTLGQDAALLCRIWCHQQQSPNTACAHQVPMTSPSVAGNESCAHISAGPTAFVREDVRQVGSGLAAQQGTVVGQLQIPPPSDSSASPLERPQAIPLAARSLVLALRI